jgi:hypothetical protein
MIKFKFAYGVFDDFGRGPKNLIIAVRNDKTAYTARFMPSGIEIRRSHPYQPYYEILWSFDWRRKKKTL